MPSLGIDRLRVWLGWDPCEAAAYEVARHSLLRHATAPVLAMPLRLSALRRQGLYTRPMTRRDGHLFDLISDAPMATEFAISRFFLPWCGGGERETSGWALFADGDVLFRRDVADLMALADPAYAVMVVQHRQAVAPGEVKMQGQPQLAYGRKNWSSVMLWNLAHPAHSRLTIDTLNALPGRDLHRLCWLRDAEIGALPEEWNWLEGHGDPACDPALVHFTRGGPWLPDWQGVTYGGEWREEAGRCFADLHRAEAA